MDGPEVVARFQPILRPAPRAIHLGLVSTMAQQVLVHRLRHQECPALLCLEFSCHGPCQAVQPNAGDLDEVDIYDHKQ